jgi:hypothetical protein
MRPERPKRRYSIDLLLGWPLIDPRDLCAGS